MTSIEQLIRSQFAKVFRASDWRFFNKVAVASLREAAKLRKKDMPIEASLKLLARKARNRVLIRIATELLLKAV